MKLPTLLSAIFLSTSTSASTSDLPADPPPQSSLYISNWTHSTLADYTIHCRMERTYKAPIYKLSALYPDLASAAPQLKVFFNKQIYAGSWDGVDAHGGARELIKMEMGELPERLRMWLKRNGTQREFSVQDGEVYFAPGAIYPLLPLWVDGVEEGECEGVFENLERYTNEPRDGAVIGKAVHESTGEKEVTFAVEAMLVKAKKGSKPKAEQGRDEL